MDVAYATVVACRISVVSGTMKLPVAISWRACEEETWGQRRKRTCRGGKAHLGVVHPDGGGGVVRCVAVDAGVREARGRVGLDCGQGKGSVSTGSDAFVIARQRSRRGADLPCGLGMRSRTAPNPTALSDGALTTWSKTKVPTRFMRTTRRRCMGTLYAVACGHEYGIEGYEALKEG